LFLKSRAQSLQARDESQDRRLDASRPLTGARGLAVLVALLAE